MFFPTPFIYNWFFGPVVFSLSLGHPAGPTASFDSLVSEFHHVSSKGFSSSKKEPPCFFNKGGNDFQGPNAGRVTALIALSAWRSSHEG